MIFEFDKNLIFFKSCNTYKEAVAGVVASFGDDAGVESYQRGDHVGDSDPRAVVAWGEVPGEDPVEIGDAGTAAGVA